LLIKKERKVIGIVMDRQSPGMAFSLAPFCNKVYRLSEITGDDVMRGIITNL